VAAAAAAEAAVAAEAAEAALALAAEAALPLAAEAAVAVAAAELAGESEAAARRGELAAGARADRLPIALTNPSPYGRVRQKRPGQSMSCLQRCPRVAKPLLTIYSTRWMRRRSAPGRSFLSNSRGPEHRAR
jgi:hypothetical protein